MATRKAKVTAKRAGPKNWVVLTGHQWSDPAPTHVDVCCGQRFVSQAAAEKEAMAHVADEDCAWVGVAHIVKVGSRLPAQLSWKDA